jgi:hypothetical protein
MIVLAVTALAGTTSAGLAGVSDSLALAGAVWSDNPHSDRADERSSRSVRDAPVADPTQTAEPVAGADTTVAPAVSPTAAPAAPAATTPATSGEGRMPELPFDIPSREALAASPKQVVAYYHTIPLYGPSNADPYGEALSPSGNGGAYEDVGGRWRQRPYPIIDNTNLTNERRVQIMHDDISEAAAIGIDAFFFNVVSGPEDSNRWNTTLTPMYDAADRFNAENETDFKVALDLSALQVSHRTGAAASPEVWADNLAPVLKRSSYYTYNGRPAVAIYNVTLLAPSWYQAFANRLKSAYGLNVYLLPSYQGNNPSDLDPYASMMPSLMPFIHGWVGPGYSVTPDNMQSSLRAWASTHNVKFMGSMGQFENDRPRELKELNGNGFSILRNMWLASIQKNDEIMQLVSWNDHEESHNIRPSTGYQYAPYDITAYYLTWYKTGAAPAIVRDTLYYAHRMQRVDAPYDTSAQPRPFVFRSTGTSPVSDNIITMAFLSAPSDVTVVSGGVRRTHSNVPAGATILTDPLSVNDQPSFSATRNGSVVVPEFTSPFRTRASVVWQDLLYRMGSSSRAPIPGVQDDLPEDR